MSAGHWLQANGRPGSPAPPKPCTQQCFYRISDGFRAFSGLEVQRAVGHRLFGRRLVARARFRCEKAPKRPRLYERGTLGKIWRCILGKSRPKTEAEAEEIEKKRERGQVLGQITFQVCLDSLASKIWVRVPGAVLAQVVEADHLLSSLSILSFIDFEVLRVARRPSHAMELSFGARFAMVSP